MTPQSPSSHRNRWLTAAMLGLLAIGIFIGRLSVAGPLAVAQDATSAEATATREAEQTELANLRTQVATTPEPPVCTPAATNTPEPSPTPSATATLVPPQSAGAPVAYGGDWTVTVTGVSLLPTFDRLAAEGIFAQVHLVIVNNTARQSAFPYEELVLRDDQGRGFIPDRQVRAINQAGWFSPFPPSLPTDGFVIFDVAADAQGPFILESATDPTFRVLVEVEVRG